ncbi:sensor domain-containing diguanylate cyclase [Methylobacterium indicum]|uniref:GGDEF domain-containing protein n=1 Tax=Methylobacterium indicum TaxID=1775910 RepID=A0A8H8WWH4_9HYPH|nr:sensor domain-containing diguanylate cyclase [Methylobacterium indicum]BCM85507.1 hypothetical protein mvi_39680 [Methylobacterium indicum]
MTSACIWVTVVAVLSAISAVTATILALRFRFRAHAAEELLDDVTDAIPGGFVLWDSNDRLVRCNQTFRDYYAHSAPFLTPGIPFEEVIRRGVAAGQYPQAAADPEAFIREVVSQHGSGEGVFERLLPNGIWLIVSELRTARGGIVGIRTDVTTLKRALSDLAAANARIEHFAHHDPLTGLPNRGRFHRELAAALARSHGGESIALLALDLDRFKLVNDTLGHGAGDELLRQVAERLTDCAGAEALVARFGGDEFMALVEGPAARDRAIAIGARIVAAMRSPFALTLGPAEIGVSVGIAVADGSDADALIERADRALYEAKRGGKGQVRQSPCASTQAA